MCGRHGNSPLSSLPFRFPEPEGAEALTEKAEAVTREWGSSRSGGGRSRSSPGGEEGATGISGRNRSLETARSLTGSEGERRKPSESADSGTVRTVGSSRFAWTGPAEKSGENQRKQSKGRFEFSEEAGFLEGAGYRGTQGTPKTSERGRANIRKVTKTWESPRNPHFGCFRKQP